MITAKDDGPSPPSHVATLGDDPWVVGFSQNPVCSADGTLLAGARNGGGWWVMRSSDGVVLRRQEHGAWPCLSPDGATVYVVAGDRITVHRVSDGALLRKMENPLPYCGARLSPDGERLLLYLWDAAILLDARDGKVLGRTPPGEPALTLDPESKPVFTADGRFAVLTSGTALLRWDLRDLVLTPLAEGDWRSICAIGAGADIVVEARDRLLRYDLAAGRAVVDGGRSTGIYGVYTHAGALWVQEIQEDQPALRLSRYDPDTLTRLPEQASVVRMNPGETCAVHGDTCWILAGGQLFMRSLTAQTPQPLPAGSRGSCVALRFSPDGAHVSAVFAHRVYHTHSSALRWAVATRERLGTFACVGEPLQLTPEGSHAVGIDKTGEARLVRAALGERGAVEVLAVGSAAPDDFALGSGGAVALLRKRTLTLLPQQQDHALPPRHQLEKTLVWDTDAALLVAPHATRTALYDLQAAGPLPALAMGKEPRAFVISRGRAWVLSKSGVAVWDLRARTCSQQIKSPLFKDHMMSLAVSRDEKLLAIGVGRGEVLLLDLSDASRSASFQACRSTSAYVSACAFSDDGAWLATGGEEGQVRVWDVAAALDGHDAARAQTVSAALATPAAAPESAAAAPAPPARFCITGRFANWSNAELEILLRARGATGMDEVPAKYTLGVLSGAQTGKKVDKARALGIPVYLPDQVRGLLGPPLSGYRERFERLRTARSGALNEQVLAIGDPAPAALLARVEERVGFPLPEAARNLWTQLDGLSYLWTSPGPQGLVDPTPIPWHVAIHQDGDLWRRLYAAGEQTEGFKMGLCCIPKLETIFFSDSGPLGGGDKGKVQLGKRKVAAQEFYPNLFLFDFFHPFYQAGLFADRAHQTFNIVYCADYCADWSVAASVPFEIYMEYLLLEWGRSRLITLTHPLGATTSISANHLSTILMPYVI